MIQFSFDFLKNWYRFILIFTFAFSILSIKAQITTSDKAIIAVADFREPKYEYKREVKFLKFPSKSVLVKYNPVSLGAGALMYVYQKHISAQIASVCPYANSCSEFSKMLIARYGLLKGVLLTADRLTRCTTLSMKDLDKKSDYTTHSHKIKDNIEHYR